MKQLYNGFCINRTDGENIYYTIQRRNFNSRPYALYINGTQVASVDTYIYRGSIVNAAKRLANTIKHNCPGAIITEIYGEEIFR